MNSNQSKLGRKHILYINLRMVIIIFITEFDRRLEEKLRHLSENIEITEQEMGMAFTTTHSHNM